MSLCGFHTCGIGNKNSGWITSTAPGTHIIREISLTIPILSLRNIADSIAVSINVMDTFKLSAVPVKYRINHLDQS